MNQHIDNIINRINQKWGHQTIRKAKQIEPKVASIKTGFKGLDAILIGIPKGYVTELAGRPTSGLTTLAHHIAAQAQRADDNVVYIQMANPLDGQYAAKCGVGFDKMLSVDVESLILALDVTRGIVQSSVVGLIILNLLSLKQRHLDLQVVLRDIRGSDCAVVLLLPSFAQSNASSLRLIVQRQKWLRDSNRIVGCLSSVTIQKNRFGRNGNQALLLMPLIQEAWT